MKDFSHGTSIPGLMVVANRRPVQPVLVCCSVKAVEMEKEVREGTKQTNGWELFRAIQNSGERTPWLHAQKSRCPGLEDIRPGGKWQQQGGECRKTKGWGGKSQNLKLTEIIIW